MAETLRKTQRVTQTVLIIFVIASVGLIIADLAGNLVYELISDQELESAGEKVTPTPIPTLTEAERREILSEPVGEEGE